MNQQILTITENEQITKTVYRMRLEGAELERQKEELEDMIAAQKAQEN